MDTGKAQAQPILLSIQPTANYLDQNTLLKQSTGLDCPPINLTNSPMPLRYVHNMQYANYDELIKVPVAS